MQAGMWQKVQDLYHAALAQTPEARSAFVAQACGSDMLLRGEVESLLAHEGCSDSLLECPAWDHVPLLSSVNEPSLSPGQEVSHYRLVDKLGEGGMGVVWRAFDSELKRHVAIKSLTESELSDDDLRARFLHEAQAASALNHPNIVTIYDIFRHEGATFLVMELVEGQPLHHLPLKDALANAIQIADALAAAHKIGIVHRDLKPANVMVTPSGRVKVLDFGLAKRAGPMGPQTAQGIIAGTASYMSPEQAEGKDVDTRSDIFSFGAVLYEMVSGRRAFDGIAAILKEDPKALAGIPAELQKTISRCLRKDPERRVQHIGDVRLALEEVRDELATARPASPAPRRTWWWLGGLLLLALAAGFVRFTRHPEAAR
jgi:serine/threonine protein kinase